MKSIKFVHGDMIAIPLIADYFGLHNKKYESTLMGIYQGLFKYGTTEEVIEQAAKCGKLDELIHKVYKNRETGYYKEFCDNNIVIGRTLLFVSENELIYDNNCCPNCETKNFENNKVNGPPDCYKCFKFICKFCSIPDDGDYICNNCKSF